MTKARRVGSINLGVDISKDYSTVQVANIEVDNHADTCYLGSNFRPAFITDQICEDQPYHTNYEAIKNVQVVSGSTTYDDFLTGRTFILTTHQALWFGSTMKNSLISLNQIRTNGIPLCDDHFDPNKKLGMEVFIDFGEEIHIPFVLDGIFCAIKTRVPTDNEMKSCMHIDLT